MMRWISMIALLCLAACASNVTHELPQTSKSDPIWQLNEGKWTFNENVLTTPPVTP